MESVVKEVLTHLLSIGGISAILMFLVWWFERSERLENAKNTNETLKQLVNAIEILLDRTPRGKE